MISWIQNTFQKHFRVFFLVLLAIIIVSFVFTIGVPGVGPAEGSVRSRVFYGVNLGSPEETERLFGDANLSVLLQAGFQALDEARLQEYAFMRQAALHLAQELNLPRPDRDALTEHIRGLRLFAGQDGQFDPQTYSRFRDSLKINPRFNDGVLARVMEDDIIYTRVQELLGGPGYVLDRDVLQQIERAETTWQINVATIDYTSFQPTINPSGEELKAWFDANAFRYEVPPQVRLASINFPASQFAEQVKLNDADVRAYYDANPGRFPNPAANAEADPAAQPDAGSDAQFAAVRDQVESALRLERARRLAAKAASDLTVALFESRADLNNVEALVRSRGLSLNALPPFSRNQPPPFLANNPQSVAEAFALSADRPISDALSTPDGAVVLVWQENLPAHPSEFTAVRDQVRTDYIENQRRQRFATLGRTLQEQLKQRVAGGEEFAAAAAAVADAQGVKIDVKSHGPFARNQPPQEVSFAALNALDGLNKGDVSPMVISGDEGLLVHAAERNQPDVGPADGRFAEVRTRMAQSLSAGNATEILRQMVQDELAKYETPTS